MNPFKTLALTLAMLALLAANAAAQCGGKTVYIQLPDGWNKTQISILWQGNITSITGTQSGAWTVFKFPTGLSNDAASKTFSFSKKATEIDNGNNWIASGARWNITGQRPQDAQGIACSVFGSGSTVYIIENLNSKGQTNITTNPPNAKVFYFYPPEDDKWIAGKSYMKSGASNATLMGVDPNMCGWYRVVYFDQDPPQVAQIWLGANGTDKIGSNGRQDDLAEGESIVSMELRNKFTEYGDTIYFVADDGYEEGWYNNRNKPNTSAGGERCTYKLAAFIYDTDMSVHPDFSCGEYDKGVDVGNGENTKANCTLGGAYSSVDAKTPGGNKKGSCTGVRKGVVQERLGPDKKIQYNAAGDKWNCWTSKSWFDTAFKSSPGVNVPRCYDMPFTQQASGRFEFDSDKLTNANGRLVGGFFPYLLTTEVDDDGTRADYSQCRNCNAKRPAQNFAPLINSITGDRFDQYDAQNSDFYDGDHPNAGAFGGDAKKSIWNWADPSDGEPTREGMSWYLHGTTAIKGTEMAPANEFFCFESHAEFIYDSEQEFIFRGDDDIWVYINDQLVVDLGGTHLAAPGHIKLSTIKPALTAGEKYPIDIFFCDRRTTMSNVRISTNMYITQKSNFYAEPKQRDNYMCANISGANNCASKMGTGGDTGKKCGPDLINANYQVEFYMVKRGSQDTVWLSPTKNRTDCSGSSNNDFVCFGGIKVTNAVYSCGGAGRCQDSDEAAKKVNVAGSYTVYARLMQGGAQQGKSLKIDQFKSEANTRIVWGRLLRMGDDGKTPVDLKDGNGGTAAETQYIIAGKRTPIYVASGNWTDDKYTAFEYEDESAGGTPYSITVSGGGGLKIYASKTGEMPKTSGTLPASGVDTLWAEGGYDIGNKEFTISQGSSTPSLKLNVYQPELKFADSDYKVISTHSGYSPRDKGYDWGEDGKIPYVSIGLPIYIVAWDPRQSKICDFCSFPLFETSATNPTPADDIWGDGIVQSGVASIKDGTLAISIAGYGEVGITDNATASWKVFGPSADVTFAEWTGLKFKMAPVPMPVSSEIFDRNGDGIGDMVRIKFSKSFKENGEFVDSLLLVLLEVNWSKDTTVYYHLSGHDVSNLKKYAYVENLYKDQNFFKANGAYWREFMQEGDSLIVIARDDTRFSKGIQTSAYEDGKGFRSEVRSYIPFKDEGIFQYSQTGSQTALQDRIPPVVVKAEYTGDKKAPGCLDKREPGCRENLVVTLSEPVFAGNESSAEAIKNPFNYCLRSQQANKNGVECPAFLEESDRQNQNWKKSKDEWPWEFTGGGENASYSATYKPSSSKEPDKMMAYAPGAKGDSIVEMVYYAYKVNVDQTTRMPRGDDWIKIRPPSPENGGVDVFRDAAGNTANPREIGVIIKGTNYYTKKPVKIAEIDPKKDSPLREIFKGGREGPWWIDVSKIDVRLADSLFNYGRVSEFLPIPKDRSVSDTAKYWYPGSVGTIFDVADNINNAVSALREDCKDKGCEIDGTDLFSASDDVIAKGITLHADVYYHTNLGDYTAHRSPIVAQCTSDIFKDARGNGNCFSNHYNYYLAWDLKTNNNRYVGAGAYVAISKFYWQIEYKIGGKKMTKAYNKDEFIDLFGARRKVSK